MYKSASILRTRGEIDQARLDDLLQPKLFQPCAPNQRASSGWVPPFGEGALVHEVAGYQRLRLAVERKVLPPDAVARAADEQAAERVKVLGRELDRIERREIREAVEFSMLAQAFTKTRYIDGHLDRQNSLLVIDTASPSAAEAFLKTLRQCLEEGEAATGVSFATLELAVSPATLMTQWLRAGNAQAPFALADECQIKSGPDGGRVTIQGQELDSEEVRAHLAGEAYVQRLRLHWDESADFTLDEAGVLRKIVVKDEGEETSAGGARTDEDAAREAMDARFALTALTLAKLIPALLAFLGAEATDQQAQPADVAVG